MRSLSSSLRRSLATVSLLLATGLTLCAAAPEKIDFQGLTFRKAFSDKNSEGPFSEYLPKGQTLDAWKKLMGYYEFTKLPDAKDAAQTLVEVLKSQNPDFPSDIIYNEATGEAVVDFVTWPKDESYVEFNVWKYQKNPKGGLIAIQYAERSSDIEPYFKKLKDHRVKVRDAMAALTLP